MSTNLQRDTTGSSIPYPHNTDVCFPDILMRPIPTQMLTSHPQATPLSLAGHFAFSNLATILDRFRDLGLLLYVRHRNYNCSLHLYDVLVLDVLVI